MNKSVMEKNQDKRMNKRTFYFNKCSKWFSRDNSFAYKSLPTTHVHLLHTYTQHFPQLYFIVSQQILRMSKNSAN